MKQREIEFRVWDTKRNEFLTDFDLCFSNYGNVSITVYPNSQDYIGDECHNGEPQRGRFIVSQFTNVFNNDAKEIIEGDILEDVAINHTVTDCVVKFEQGMFCVVSIYDDYLFDELYKHRNSKIIGNIYENKELLNKYK